MSRRDRLRGREVDARAEIGAAGSDIRAANQSATVGVSSVEESRGLWHGCCAFFVGTDRPLVEPGIDLRRFLRPETEGLLSFL